MLIIAKSLPGYGSHLSFSMCLKTVKQLNIDIVRVNLPISLTLYLHAIKTHLSQTQTHSCLGKEWHARSFSSLGNVEKKSKHSSVKQNFVWYFVISAHHKYRMVYSVVSLSLLPTPTAENFLVNTCCETFDTVNHAHVLPSHFPPRSQS